MATLDEILECFWAKLEACTRLPPSAAQSAQEAQRNQGEELEKPLQGKKTPHAAVNTRARPQGQRKNRATAPAQGPYRRKTTKHHSRRHRQRASCRFLHRKKSDTLLPQPWEKSRERSTWPNTRYRGPIVAIAHPLTTPQHSSKPLKLHLHTKSPSQASRVDID
ncbi:Hypothetical predicted protein [Pelobates cultripes]|uniref:Uncharacterized protein n=1 Tax=Pelobates cultripes TaxID=61616 RepID=A0AAD1SZD9_PELCU|nr:Hypothetical predicted protein [Pelobates cultripes]